LAYADDVNIMGEHRYHAQNEGALLGASKEVGLEVNPEKTKYMLMSHRRWRTGPLKMWQCSNI
jgi:hypothetical protein